MDVFNIPLAVSPKFQFTWSGKGAVSKTFELKLTAIPLQVELCVIEKVVCAFDLFATKMLIIKNSI